MGNIFVQINKGNLLIVDLLVVVLSETSPVVPPELFMELLLPLVEAAFLHQQKPA